MIPVICIVLAALLGGILGELWGLTELQHFLLSFSFGVFGAVAGIMLETWSDDL